MDKEQIQQHMDTVREALDAFKKSTGIRRIIVSKPIEENAVTWLTQSLTIMEQQQREIERLRNAIIAAAEEEWSLAGEPTSVITILDQALKEVSTDVQDDR